MGGNSLLLVEAHGRLRRLLGRELTLVDLMRHPTVSSLAQHLGEGAAPAAREAEARQKKLDERMARQRRALGRGRTSR